VSAPTTRLTLLVVVVVVAVPLPARRLVVSPTSRVL
jgi:hypothetical protein